MGRITTLLFTIFLLLSFLGKGQELSDKSEISVYTMGPYQGELYSAFGHNAFRVYDPLLNLDLIYNYGIFDFAQPNFYLNFAKGKPYYMLGVQYYEPFIKAYIEENRRIVQQVLNLTKTEKQDLFDFLQWNAQPENRNYFYNYVYDNCATRIRDVVDSLFSQVDYNNSYVTDNLTIRDLMDMYLQDQPWGDLGIDFCLGIGIDKVATGYQYMYMPEFIEKAFSSATVASDDFTKHLVLETRVIHKPDPTPEKRISITPFWTFLVLFLLFAFLSYKDFIKGKRTNWVDILLFSVTGILGWLLLYLWFFTNHISEYNFNLLWALPFHFPIALLLLRRKKSGFIKYYFLITAIILTILLFCWSLWPQDMNEGFIPIVLILLMRALLVFRIEN